MLRRAHGLSGAEIQAAEEGGDVAGRYSVAGRPQTAMGVWRDANCEWQGGSTKDCVSTIEAIPVHVQGMADFRTTVHVCTTHAPAYRRAAMKAGLFA